MDTNSTEYLMIQLLALTEEADNANFTLMSNVEIVAYYTKLNNQRLRYIIKILKNLK